MNFVISPADGLTPRQVLARLARLLIAVLVAGVAFLVPFIPALLMQQSGYGLASDLAAPSFKLQDRHGNRVSLTDFRGKFVYLMFGYLNCREVCHSEALMFKEIQRAADMGQELIFLFVAIDPDRDNPEAVARYFDSRGPGFISLHGKSKSELQQLALSYNNYFYAEPARGTGDYDINHGGNYYLIDPAGKLAFTYTSSHRQLDMLLNDLSSLTNS